MVYGRGSLSKENRICIIGSGFVGRKHAAAYATLPNAKLQVICDTNQNSAMELAALYGFERIEANWRKAVRANDVDIVCICVPNQAHFEIACEAAKMGKHICCEKPLGMNSEESENLALLVKEKNVIASCCYNLIRIPAIQYAKKILEEGNLGELVCFRGSYDNDRLVDPDALFEWRMCKRNANGGSLCDLALNILAVSQYLFGDILAVSGMTEIVHSQRRDINGHIQNVENDDVAQFICSYRYGGMGYISSNRVAPGSKQDMRFEAQLTKGSIRFSLERMNEIQIYSMGGQGFTTIISDESGWFHAGYEELKQIDAESLLKNIEMKTCPETDFVFASKIDRVIEAVIESSQTKQWVMIEK